MSGTVLALFGVAVAAALGEMLIPGAESGGTHRFLQFLTALVMLVLVLQPFLARLSDANGFLDGEVEWREPDVQAEYEQIFSDAVANRSAVQLREGLVRLLQAEYGIEPQNCEVGVVLGKDGMPEKIGVILSGKALLQDPDEIQRMLHERFGCEVEVR